MADLPQDRLEPPPPFSYCGVDYFGPWYVKEGRKELKKYGVLFTCMASRAIHLEVACTMETDFFYQFFATLYLQTWNNKATSKRPRHQLY